MDGFNTFEKQDKILLGLNSGSDAAAALRILQQQGFAVQTFTVENAVSAAELLQLLTDRLLSWTVRLSPPGTLPASR